MTFLEENVSRLIQYIWSTVLGIDLRPLPRAMPSKGLDESFTGSVEIEGEWSGAVLFVCPEPLARKAASIMLGAEPREVTVEDMKDAVGELTNVIGGNLKALAGGECFVSVPEVVRGQGHCLQGEQWRLLNRLVFVSEGEPFEVALLKRGPGGPGMELKPAGGEAGQRR